MHSTGIFEFWFGILGLWGVALTPGVQVSGRVLGSHATACRSVDAVAGFVCWNWPDIQMQ